MICLNKCHMDVLFLWAISNFDLSMSLFLRMVQIIVTATKYTLFTHRRGRRPGRPVFIIKHNEKSGKLDAYHFFLYFQHKKTRAFCPCLKFILSEPILRYQLQACCPKYRLAYIIHQRQQNTALRYPKYSPLRLQNKL